MYAVEKKIRSTDYMERGKYPAKIRNRDNAADNVAKRREEGKKMETLGYTQNTSRITCPYYQKRLAARHTKIAQRKGGEQTEG